MKLRFHPEQVKRGVEYLNQAPLIKLAPLMVIDKTKGISNITPWYVYKCLLIWNRINEVQSRNLPIPSLLVLPNDLLLPLPLPLPSRFYPLP